MTETLTPLRVTASRGTREPVTTSAPMTSKATRPLAGRSRANRALKPPAPSGTAATPRRASRTLDGRPGSFRSTATGGAGSAGRGSRAGTRPAGLRGAAVARAAAVARGRACGPARQPVGVPERHRRILHPLGAVAPGRRRTAVTGRRTGRPEPDRAAGERLRDAGPRNRPVRDFLRRAAGLRAVARLPGPGGAAGARPGTRGRRRPTSAATSRAQAASPAPATPRGPPRPWAATSPRRREPPTATGTTSRGIRPTVNAGNPATSVPGTGAYPDASAASGYAANGYARSNGYGSNGYGTGAYQTNGYGANGSTVGEYSPGENASRGAAPSGAYPRLPANGYANGYAGGSLPGNGPASGTAPPASAPPSANGASYQAAPEYGQASPNGAVPAGAGGQVNGAGYAAGHGATRLPAEFHPHVRRGR